MSVATRFPMPVRQLAFSPSGSTLAAAGDDETIKLVSLANEKVCFPDVPRQWKPYTAL